MVDLNADPNACAAWIARFLKARGIDRIFGLQGGHIQPIWDFAARLGIRIIDVRDEGAAVSPDELATRFVRAKRETIEELLHALATLGQVRRLRGGKYASS